MSALSESAEGEVEERARRRREDNEPRDQLPRFEQQAVQPEDEFGHKDVPDASEFNDAAVVWQEEDA